MNKLTAITCVVCYVTYVLLIKEVIVGFFIGAHVLQQGSHVALPIIHHVVTHVTAKVYTLSHSRQNRIEEKWWEDRRSRVPGRTLTRPEQQWAIYALRVAASRVSLSHHRGGHLAVPLTFTPPLGGFPTMALLTWSSTMFKYFWIFRKNFYRKFFFVCFDFR